MAYSSHAMNEGEVILPSFSWNSYEYEGVPTNGDHLPSDATFYGCLFFNSSSYYLEGLLQAIIPSPCREEEPGFHTSPWDITLETEESYDGEQQPYNGCGNWLNDCNSAFNGCWEDNYGSFGNVSNNNLENMENSNPSEEQGESSLTRRDDEDAENHLAVCDYDPWSCCGSWLTFGWENVSLADDGEGTDVSYERVLHDAEVYEGIFGHWPCLYGRH